MFSVFRLWSLKAIGQFSLVTSVYKACYLIGKLPLVSTYFFNYFLTLLTSRVDGCLCFSCTITNNI